MVGQIWATATSGGYMYTQKLSQELRMAVQPMCKFRQFCDAQDATKARNPEGNMLGKGDLFHWNVYSDIANQGTTLAETSTIPETNFTITQGTLTVTEFGNSVPYTGKLDDLSEQPVKAIIHKVMKNDCKKAFDSQAHAQFNSTPLRVVPTGGTSTTAVTLTTNGTATATNSVAMGKGHVKAIVDLMKERNIPPYIADDYVATGWPTTFRTFKNDLESIHQYTDQGFRLIHNGEIGRYENTRFVEQTFIPKGGAANATTYDPWSGTAQAWANGLSSWAFMMGGDTVTEAICVPEEIRAKLPGDFGRSRGIAWYYLGGFGLVHTDANNCRVFMWDSAT